MPDPVHLALYDQVIRLVVPCEDRSRLQSTSNFLQHRLPSIRIISTLLFRHRWCRQTRLLCLHRPGNRMAMATYLPRAICRRWPGSSRAQAWLAAIEAVASSTLSVVVPAKLFSQNIQTTRCPHRLHGRCPDGICGIIPAWTRALYWPIANPC